MVLRGRLNCKMMGLLIMVLDVEFFVCLVDWNEDGYKVMGCFFYEEEKEWVYERLE